MPERDSNVQYRDVPGLPGYSVGDDGSVWSLWKLRPIPGQGSESFIGTEWKRLKPGRDRKGYLYISVKAKPHRVHRLVLLAFVGPCPEGMEACHFPDPDPKNCRLNNLRWDTKRSNSLDRRVHGTERGLLQAGEANKFAKLTDAQIAEIRALHGKLSQRKIAAKYNISCGHVHRILHNTQRKPVQS